MIRIRSLFSPVKKDQGVGTDPMEPAKHRPYRHLFKKHLPSTVDYFLNRGQPRKKCFYKKEQI